MATLAEILTTTDSVDATAEVGADGHVKVTTPTATYDLGSLYTAPTDPNSFAVNIVKVLEALATNVVA